MASSPPSGEGEPTMAFFLMTRKGNKAQFKNLAVPTDSELAQNLRNRELAERVEKERVKKLTLDFNERQEEEEFQDQFQSVNKWFAVYRFNWGFLWFFKIYLLYSGESTGCAQCQPRTTRTIPASQRCPWCGVDIRRGAEEPMKWFSILTCWILLSLVLYRLLSSVLKFPR